MKKRILAALSAAVCLLSGCGAAPAAPVQSAPPPAVSSGEEQPAPQSAVEQVIFTAAMSTSRSTVYVEENPLINASFRYPVLSAHRQDGTPITEAKTEKEAAALAAEETFNATFAHWESGENIAEDVEHALEDYAWHTDGEPWFGSYAMELDCTAYQTARMVSVSGLYYAYIGGAHPNTVNLAWNFDLQKGEFFGPEYLGGSEMITAVAEELKRQSHRRAEEFGAKPEELYWTDYETILNEWPSAAVSFDAEGMTVSYSPYELAPYAFGAQIYDIPYEFLLPYLSLEGMELLGLILTPGA